ncbi:hypothetical protein JCM6882_009730 [Rhodosporidiobolus microsporus]
MPPDRGAAGASGGKKRAFTTTWRAMQTKKNKSWDFDGYLLVDGAAATFSDNDGKMMGQRTLTKPLDEGDEYSFGSKDFLVVDAMSLAEYFAAVSPATQRTALGTPAKPGSATPAKGGWFSRAGQTSTHTPQLASRTASTSASTSASASKASPAVTSARPSLDSPVIAPDSAPKKWLKAQDKVQRPFKPLVPQKMQERSSSTDLFSGLPDRKTSVGTPGPSRLSREVGRGNLVEVPTTGFAGGSGRSASKGKGKERERDAADAEDERDIKEDVENSPPSSQVAKNDQPASKKRRVDPFADLEAAAAPQVAARAGPHRGSAADAAFEKAVSRNGSSSSSTRLNRSTSAAGSRPKPWDDLPAPARPTPQGGGALFRKASPPPAAAPSPVKTAVKPEPADEGAEVEQFAAGEDTVMQAVKPEPEDEFGLELDAAMFANEDELEQELGAGSESHAADDSGCFEGTRDAECGEGEEEQEEEDEEPVRMEGKKSLDKGKGKGKAKAAVQDDEEMEEATVSQTQTQEGGGTKRYFSVCWRKRTAKKHPSFEDDGVLVVKGEQAELREVDSSQRIASGRIARNAMLEEGEELEIGGMTVLIERSIEKPNLRASSSAASSKPAAPPTGARKPFRPPTAATAKNPLARSSAGLAAAARSASPPAALPNRAETPAARATSVSSSSFFLPGTTAPSASKFRPLAEGGKSMSGRKVGPRFDPEKKGAVVMQRPNEEHQKEYNPKGIPVVDVVVDPIIGDKLREHQKEGVRFMYECVMGMRTAGQGCILADDMGLGKTIQSIALIWTLLKQTPYFGDGVGAIQRAMIVCPVTLVKNWSSEIKKWLGKDRLRVMVADSKKDAGTFARSKSYDVLIIGYEKLRTCIDEVRYAQPPVGLIICDEGHRLKSAGAKTTQALCSLSCTRRVILSGTPIQNNLGEFFAMMDFVNPGLFETAKYFKQHFEQPITKSRQPNASKKDKEAGLQASELLSEMQRNFVLRRTNEVNQKHLPPKLEYSVFILPTALEIALYRQVLSGSSVAALLEGHGRQDQLSLLTSLRKLANTPGLIMQDASTEKGCEGLGEELVDLLPQNVEPSDFALSGKLSTLGTLLAELRSTSDEKIVVISNFTKTLDIVEKHCKRKKYPFCRLDGQTAQAERIPMVNNFNRGPHKSNFIFLLSSKSGGTGLNIIGASRLVMLDADWNPSTDAQAMARIHREGQQRTCIIYRFFTVGTIDEKVFQRQITKLALAGSIMGEDAAAGGTSKGGNTFSPEELRAIFTIHDESACETHDLLGCRCHFGEDIPSDDDEEGDDSEAEEDDPGFLQASQWQGDSSKQAAKQRRNLSILKTWTHYNCSNDKVIDSIEDQLLRSLIYERIGLTDDEGHTLSPQGNGALRLRGGQVSWVFGKKSG